ncbi:MAG: hypothetical protein QHJ73_17895, partial [Armatimonadota bacterium]|nr:hypothetical protein [Armatimonadota bacterium]
MKVQQISVFLENKSGRLSDVLNTLACWEINIRALSIADTIDYGLLRLIVNDPDKATKVLAAEGFTVRSTDVLAIEVPDRPGGLAGIVEPFRDDPGMERRRSGPRDVPRGLPHGVRQSGDVLRLRVEP